MNNLPNNLSSPDSQYNNNEIESETYYSDKQVILEEKCISDKKKSEGTNLVDKEDKNKGCMGHTNDFFNLSLLKSTVFLLYTFNMFTFFYANTVSVTFLPELAMSYGIIYRNASFLIPVLGLTSVVSRLVIGWVSDKFPKKR